MSSPLNRVRNCFSTSPRSSGWPRNPRSRFRRSPFPFRTAVRPVSMRRFPRIFEWDWRCPPWSASRIIQLPVFARETLWCCRGWDWSLWLGPRIRSIATWLIEAARAKKYGQRWARTFPLWFQRWPQSCWSWARSQRAARGCLLESLIILFVQSR